jgi:hypothetical protein
MKHLRPLTAEVGEHEEVAVDVKHPRHSDCKCLC